MLSARGRARYEDIRPAERDVGDFLPFTAQVSPTTLASRSGDLMCTFRCAGLPHETADHEDILERKGQLNTLFQSLGASGHDVALWIHTIPRRLDDDPGGSFDGAFCRDLDAAYRATFDDYRAVRPEHYVTLVHRPRASSAGRLFSRAARRSLEQRIATQKRDIAVLDDLAGKLERGLAPYAPMPLGTYEAPERGPDGGDGGSVTCSELLSFVEFLISGEWQEIRLPTAPLNEALGQASVFAGVEMLEIRSAARTRYAQGLDLKVYPADVAPGTLNGLFYLGHDFVLTQSFSFTGTVAATERLGRQLTLLENSGNGAPTEERQIGEALDDLAQDRFAMGDYHFSLMVSADTPELCERAKRDAVKLLQERRFVVAQAALALDAMWYAQLPGNFVYRPRLAFLTTRNLACLASMHGFVLGKAHGNPWGEAVTRFKTPAGYALNYNFHIESSREDLGEKVLGNARIIGTVGSGKTTWLGFVLAQAQRFDASARGGPALTTVVFDLDRGARPLVAAMGGRYFAIRSGHPSGLNPFRLERTPAATDFLNRLVRMLVTRNGETLSAADENAIGRGIDAVYLLPPHLRRLSALARSIPERAGTDNGLVRRLRRWCAQSGDREAGPWAWALDNPEDELDLHTHRIYGIDGTEFLDNAEVRGPISFYLLHRIKAAMGRGRFIYAMDEAWRWLDDDEFGDFAGAEQVTIRKKDGLGIFATQMPSQLLANRHARALVEQVATEIYLPNPRATRADYVEGFKLTETEFETIRSLPEGGREFLIRQKFAGGRRHGVIGRLDLHGLDDTLAILSGSSESNALLDAVIAEVGDDPDVWLPLFHRRRAARDDAHRLARENPTDAPTRPALPPAPAPELARTGTDPDH